MPGVPSHRIPPPCRALDNDVLTSRLGTLMLCASII